MGLIADLLSAAALWLLGVLLRLILSVVTVFVAVVIALGAWRLHFALGGWLADLPRDADLTVFFTTAGAITIFCMALGVSAVMVVLAYCTIRAIWEVS